MKKETFNFHLYIVVVEKKKRSNPLPTKELKLLTSLIQEGFSNAPIDLHIQADVHFKFVLKFVLI